MILQIAPDAGAIEPWRYTDFLQFISRPNSRMQQAGLHYTLNDGFAWKRAAAKNDDPAQQHEKKRESIAKEILRSDETAANRSLDDDLDRLRTLQSHPGGQNSAPPQSE